MPWNYYVLWFMNFKKVSFIHLQTFFFFSILQRIRWWKCLLKTRFWTLSGRNSRPRTSNTFGKFHGQRIGLWTWRHFWFLDWFGGYRRRRNLFVANDHCDWGPPVWILGIKPTGWFECRKLCCSHEKWRISMVNIRLKQSNEFPWVNNRLKTKVHYYPISKNKKSFFKRQKKKCWLFLWKQAW